MLRASLLLRHLQLPVLCAVDWRRAGHARATGKARGEGGKAARQAGRALEVNARCCWLRVRPRAHVQCAEVKAAFTGAAAARAPLRYFRIAGHARRVLVSVRTRSHSTVRRAYFESSPECKAQAVWAPRFCERGGGPMSMRSCVSARTEQCNGRLCVSVCSLFCRMSLFDCRRGVLCLSLVRFDLSVPGLDLSRRSAVLSASSKW